MLKKKSFVSSPVRNTALALTVFVAFGATQALAECDEAQETATGKAIAAASASAIAKVVPAQGKQMVNLDTCETAGASVTAEFKYNVLTPDGLYWASGRARLQGGAVAELKFSKLSPNLNEASAKTGIKLAAN
jgi:hypothetical protein